MEKFVIAPHMRLHEWVAIEKGYFDEVGLNHELDNVLIGEDGKLHDLGNKVGAFQTFEDGRSCDVSSACHWTVKVASASGHGKLYADAYSVAPCAIFVHPKSGINKPEDLKSVPISVGYRSGSHYSSIQALEQFLSSDEIELSFSDGLLFNRMDLLIEGKIPAASLFSGPYYYMEQLGYKKVLDTSFMMASMVSEDADLEEIKKYFGALRKAQTDIDLHPELYTHYYKNEFPKKYKGSMDTRLFGPGERIVFEPYTRKIFESAQKWISERKIFGSEDLGTRDYKNSVVVTA